MKRTVILLILSLCLAVLGIAARAAAQARPGGQAGPAPAARRATSRVLAAEDIQKKVEAYLRKLYAWGPAFQVKVGKPADSPLPGFYQVSVDLAVGSQSETAMMHISKDGRYLIPGDVLDTAADPFAANRKQLFTQGRPAIGPADAAVTVVEFIDFQCPHCRQLDKALRELRPQYPQVRFVIKNFPLTQIHPWAMTGAIAAECAYRQNREAFWKFHDALFDQQDAITPGNAWEKMLALAQAAGLDSVLFRACMASPEAKQTVEQDIQHGQALRIANTPTTFINGRRTLSTDSPALKQLIDYELATTAPANRQP